LTVGGFAVTLTTAADVPLAIDHFAALSEANWIAAGQHWGVGVTTSCNRGSH
jgi:hypothetical protein